LTGAALRRVVVVGASLAGLRAAERLRADGFEGELTVVGDEPHPPYDRPPLSKELLAGEIKDDAVALRGRDELAADWLLGRRATALNPRRGALALDDGRELPYDGLVVATGSAPRRLPELDPALPGVFELRTLDDARRLREALAARPRVAIVGSGFIGTEVASTCRKLGLEVEIVTLDPPLAIAGQLASRICSQLLAEHDVRVRVGRRVTAWLGGGHTEGLELDDGSRVEADVVLVAIGAAPVTGWLEGSGAWLGNGVACDAHCRVLGLQGVVAAGDVARWPNARFRGREMRVEHWTNAVEQGVAAARTLLRGASENTTYAPIPSFWSDQFGVRFQSIGLPGLADRFEIEEGTVAERRFAAAAYRAGELVGALSCAAPKGLVKLRARLARECPERPVLAA
jgi:3-phenylpropionate/trans-cinnamate dioxygenase ferredoxin reductase component